MMADIEVERQRRQLIQENEQMKARLRAAESLLESGSQERVKFMEGASWIAKKVAAEGDRHAAKTGELAKEFEARVRASIIDEKLMDYDGRRIEATKQWLSSEMQLEANDLKSRFDHIFENVNYQLSNAVKSFKK